MGQRLRLVYREAHLHISSLLQSARIISESSTCFQATHSLYEEKLVSLEYTIHNARKAMCKGHLDGLQAELHAHKVQERLLATRRLVGPSCLDMDWTEYFSSVESLVELTLSRPKCQTCCSMANMSADSADGVAMLQRPDGRLPFEDHGLHEDEMLNNSDREVLDRRI